VDPVPLLVDHGADVAAQDNTGSTQLQLARDEGETDSVLSSTDHSTDGSGQLHLAAEEGGDRARPLVENIADGTFGDSDGPTQSHLAAQEGNVDASVACSLVEHAAEVTAQDNNGGSTELRLAVQEGSMALAQSLVERSVDLTAHNDNGSIPSPVRVERVTQSMYGLLRRIGHRFQKTWQSIACSSSVMQA
jgi:ankyrin repeat protein